jgi:SET domain-containing protein
MALLEKHLFIKESTIPNAGRGLFTKAFIPKGENIVQYKGRVTTWKEISANGVDNLYIMYVTAKNVIDANNYKKSFARYANDASGLTKIKGLKNNGAYVHDEKGKVFIEAKRDILPGEEIFVGYGKDYWDTIRHNMKIGAEEEKKKAAAEKKTKAK